MNAIILAGGFGNRLMPLTQSKPKPVLTVGNIPMLDYTVSQLTHFGIRDIVFTLAHMPEKIIEWTVGYKNVSCHYNIESVPLGTCGGVRSAQAQLDDTFYVLSGDGLSNIDLKAMLDVHNKTSAEITMAVTLQSKPSLYGVVEADKNGFVRLFKEKPKDYIGQAYINCGVYLINKSVLSMVPSDTVYDFSNNLFPSMLSSNKKIAVYVHDGYWSDIGSPKSYHKSNLDILKLNQDKRCAFFEPEYNIFRKYYQSNLSLQDASLISRRAEVLGRVKNSVIAANSNILEGASLEGCVVLENSTISGRYKNCIIDGENIIDIENIAKASKIHNSQDIKSHNSTSFLA